MADCKSTQFVINRLAAQLSLSWWFRNFNQTWIKSWTEHFAGEMLTVSKNFQFRNFIRIQIRYRSRKPGWRSKDADFLKTSFASPNLRNPSAHVLPLNGLQVHAKRGDNRRSKLSDKLNAQQNFKLRVPAMRRLPNRTALKACARFCLHEEKPRRMDTVECELIDLRQANKFTRLSWCSCALDAAYAVSYSAILTVCGFLMSESQMNGNV